MVAKFSWIICHPDDRKIAGGNMAYFFLCCVFVEKPCELSFWLLTSASFGLGVKKEWCAEAIFYVQTK